jgi:hypothetical protein
LSIEHLQRLRKHCSQEWRQATPKIMMLLKLFAA